MKNIRAPFTVSLFDEFLWRAMPEFELESGRIRPV